MSIIRYIVIGIVILFVLLMYILFLLAYLGASKGYREAIKTEAIIIEDLGDIKLATGSVAIGVPRYRTFHKYKVSYSVNGVEYIDDAELKNRKLSVGDVTEVRYAISKKGKVSLESQAFLCWTREWAFSCTGGLILGIVLGILKVKGIIQ